MSRPGGAIHTDAPSRLLFAAFTMESKWRVVISPCLEDSINPRLEVAETSLLDDKRLTRATHDRVRIAEAGNGVSLQHEVRRF